MAYEISEDTKKRTSKCPYNFECVAGGKCVTCRVEKEISGALIIDRICNKQLCKYFLFFGSRNICMCPVRVEIYRRYNV